VRIGSLKLLMSNHISANLRHIRTYFPCSALHPSLLTNTIQLFQHKHQQSVYRLQETQFCPVPVSLCTDHVVARPHLYIFRYSTWSCSSRRNQQQSLSYSVVFRTMCHRSSRLSLIRSVGGSGNDSFWYRHSKMVIEQVLRVE